MSGLKLEFEKVIDVFFKTKEDRRWQVNGLIPRDQMSTPVLGDDFLLLAGAIIDELNPIIEKLEESIEAINIRTKTIG